MSLKDKILNFFKKEPVGTTSLVLLAITLLLQFFGGPAEISKIVGMNFGLYSDIDPYIDIVQEYKLDENTHFQIILKNKSNNLVPVKLEIYLNPTYGAIEYENKIYPVSSQGQTIDVWLKFNQIGEMQVCAITKVPYEIKRSQTCSLVKISK